MPKEIFPSSFECDCGHQSQYFENTVKEMKAMSQKKKVYLGDAAPEEHTIVFHRGKLVKIRCPKQPQSHVPKKRRLPRSTSSKETLHHTRDTGGGQDGRCRHYRTLSIPQRSAIPIAGYVPRYKGKFLYLDRQDYGRLHPICRLEYTGKMEEWSFAIYKYSDEHYDAEEWFFPGSGYVDGTIEGAMKAGLEAYPA